METRMQGQGVASPAHFMYLQGHGQKALAQGRAPSQVGVRAQIQASLLAARSSSWL